MLHSTVCRERGAANSNVQTSSVPCPALHSLPQPNQEASHGHKFGLEDEIMAKEKTTTSDRKIHIPEKWKPYMPGIAIFIALAMTVSVTYWWWDSRPPLESSSEPSSPHSSETPGTGTKPEPQAESAPESMREELESRVLNMETQP